MMRSISDLVVGGEVEAVSNSGERTQIPSRIVDGTVRSRTQGYWKFPIWNKNSLREHANPSDASTSALTTWPAASMPSTWNT